MTLKFIISFILIFCLKVFTCDCTPADSNFKVYEELQPGIVKVTTSYYLRNNLVDVYVDTSYQEELIVRILQKFNMYDNAFIGYYDTIFKVRGDFTPEESVYVHIDSTINGSINFSTLKFVKLSVNYAGCESPLQYLINKKFIGFYTDTNNYFLPNNFKCNFYWSDGFFLDSNNNVTHSSFPGVSVCIDTLITRYTSIEKKIVTKNSTTFNIYPNPTFGSLYLQSNNLVNKIQLFDLNGRNCTNLLQIKNDFFKYTMLINLKGRYLLTFKIGNNSYSEKLIIR